MKIKSIGNEYDLNKPEEVKKLKTYLYRMKYEKKQEAMRVIYDQVCVHKDYQGKEACFKAAQKIYLYLVKHVSLAKVSDNQIHIKEEVKKTKVNCVSKRQNLSLFEVKKEEEDKEEKGKIVVVSKQDKKSIQNDVLKHLFTFLLLTPSQQLTLKLVSKEWKQALDEIPFLFPMFKNLSSHLGGIAMAIAPVNSSGDTYHMVVAVMLAAKYGNKLPPIFLAEDEKIDKKHDSKKMDTFLQVERSINFASQLGYKESFFALHTEKEKTTKPAPRQAQLEKKLFKNGVTTYLDNRLATTLIARCVKQDGIPKITGLLRKEFKQNLFLLTKDQRNTIDDFVNTHIKELISLYEKTKRPLLIIHYRYSDKANNQQDLSSIVPEITKALSEKYNIVAIYADPRKKSTELKGSLYDIYPFGDNIVDKQDISKLLHIHLLIALYENENKIGLKGLVGNTSGTLDMAAFLGHSVFNIHQFKNNHMDYQGWRILLQSHFMVIENAGNILRVCEKNKNHLINNLCLWLENGQQQYQPQALVKTTKGGLGEKGFACMNSVFTLLGNDMRVNKIKDLENLEEETEKSLYKFKFL